MVKVAIIGSGFGMYGLLPAFSQTLNCQVVALCARDSDRVRAAVTKYHVPTYLHDWQEVFKQVEFDAIATAVTPQIQFEIVQLALQQGKHVFAEKPLAANLSQARQLMQLVATHRQTTAIDFIFPEIAAWQQLISALQNKVIGTPKQYHLIWNFQSADSKLGQRTWKSNPAMGGGAVAYYFSHSLYVLEKLFGQMTVTDSQLRYADPLTKTVELAIDLKASHEDGISGTAHFQSDARDDQKHELVVEGTQGRLTLSSKQGVTRNFKVTLTVDGQTSELPVSEPIGHPDEDERVPSIQKITQRFIDACRSQTNMSPSFQDGFRVQELIEEIRQKATLVELK